MGNRFATWILSIAAFLYLALSVLALALSSSGRCTDVFCVVIVKGFPEPWSLLAHLLGETGMTATIIGLALNFGVLLAVASWFIVDIPEKETE